MDLTPRRHEHTSYAGFLWWLSHLGDADCKIVDVTDLALGGDTAGVATKRLAVSPAVLEPDELARLLGTEVSLDPADRAKHQAR